MRTKRRSKPIITAFTVTILSIVLHGCLTGSGESASDSADTQDLVEPNEITGSVGDGPIVGAAMRILRNDGVELARMESSATASFNVVVRTKGKYYPLSIEASNGIDLVTNSAPDFELLSAVREPGKKSIANVNPFSTFTVELAGHLPGGPSKANLVAAEAIVSAELNNGLTSLATSGSMNTKIDRTNIAEIVRASEALGETVRRTRAALEASGYPTSADSVVRAVAADLTDSVVDGRGGSGSDARLAAVWNIVSAQVLLETMANELHVGGSDATQLMSNAIASVLDAAGGPALADLTVTAEMIEQARVGLVAAYGITSDPTIADLLDAMEGIQSGAGSATVRNSALPGDYRLRLDNAVLLTAGGSAATLGIVNDISRNRTQTIGSDPGPDAGSTPGSDSVTLNWTPPTHNEDGSPLIDLAGFRIYWGTTPGSYPNSVTIGDPSATTYVVDNLSPGTYEFVATAFNTSGVESAYSSPATKVVQ